MRQLVPDRVSEDDKLVEYDFLLLDRFLDILQDLHGEDMKETVIVDIIINLSLSLSPSLSLSLTLTVTLPHTHTFCGTVLFQQQFPCRYPQFLRFDPRMR